MESVRVGKQLAVAVRVKFFLSIIHVLLYDKHTGIKRKRHADPLKRNSKPLNKVEYAKN